MISEEIFNEDSTIQRREMVVKAVAQHGVSIALACRAVQISETCYRYERKLSDENAEIAAWLVKLTTRRRTWGFGLCVFCICATSKALAGTTNGSIASIASWSCTRGSSPGSA